MKLRRRKEPPSVVAFRRVLVENGAVDVDLDVDPNVIATLYASLAKLLHDAPNYVEARVSIKPARERVPYVVTVQREDRPTPHELREQAEARLGEYDRLLARLMDEYQDMLPIDELNHDLLDEIVAFARPPITGATE